MLDVPGGAFVVEAYAWGVLGSVTVEIAAAVRRVAEADGRCPPLYRSPLYIGLRLALAFVCAGALPIVLQASNPLTAFYLGASAPVLLDRAARGTRGGHEKPEPEGE